MEVTTIWKTVLRGLSIRKAKKCCSSNTQRITFNENFLVTQHDTRIDVDIVLCVRIPINKIYWLPQIKAILIYSPTKESLIGKNTVEIFRAEGYLERRGIWGGLKIWNKTQAFKRERKKQKKQLEKMYLEEKEHSKWPSVKRS